MSQDDSRDKAIAEQRAGIKKIVENTDWHSLSELYQHQARICHLKYRAAQRFGFTNEQALDMCTKPWA